MEPFLDADTLLELVLPKLLRMTVMSAVVGGVVGLVVAATAAVLQRSRRRRSGTKAPKAPASTGRLVWSALWGSFLGTFLAGLLPIEANPASLIGGPYAGLWFLFMVLVFVPGGAVGGAVLGILTVASPRSRNRLLRVVAAITLGAYLISALVLTLTLSPPAVAVRTHSPQGPFPLVAEISGIESLPSHLALSADGQRLAVLSVRYGRQQIDIVDLTTRKRQRIRKLHGKPEGQQTLQDILATLAFTADGQELVTAAVQQVQVRTLPDGRPRLRLEGGEVAYPMADERLVTLASVDAAAARPTPQSLKVWNLSSGELLQSLAADLNTVEREMLPIAMSPDRRLLAFPRRLYDDRIEVWNISEGRQVSTLELENPAGILALAFSPDGGELALSLGQGPPISIWDLATARQIHRIDRPERVQQLYWTTQGLLAGYDGAFRVLSPRDGTVQHTLQLGSTGPSSANRPVLPMALSALSGDGNTLAAHFADHGIGVWRVGQAH